MIGGIVVKNEKPTSFSGGFGPGFHRQAITIARLGIAYIYIADLRCTQVSSFAI